MGVPVLVAYADVPSARQALTRVTALIRSRQPDADLRPMLWRFDQLAESRWRDMALRDASRAGVLVLAMPDEEAFCPRTEAWLSALLGCKRGGNLTILALIGDRDAWTITLAQPMRAIAAKRESAMKTTEVFASVAPKSLAACAA